MADTNDIASNIVNALYISDPEVDTSIGSPLRKVIDAISDQIAQVTTDDYLINYQYDIDSKTGGDLDDFCANFGIARLPGARAKGVLTFSRPSGSDTSTAILIPMGSQAGTTDIPSQTFSTTVSSIIDVGAQSIDVASQAINEGTDGNIAASTQLTLLTTIPGVSTVTNNAAFVGGTIDETDDQLRARFKATVFRNLAGTNSMYTGIALQTLANNANGSFGVARVNVLGGSTHWYEQIQISGGSASTSLNTAAYIYPDSVFITNSNGNLMVPQTNFTTTITEGTTYGSRASLTINAITSNMPDGFYYLEFDYVPNVSRNDVSGIRFGQGVVNNRIDVYVNGINPATATQTVYYVPSVTFNNNPSSNLYNQFFVDAQNNNPAVGDVFLPLAYGPILDLSLPQVLFIEQLTIGGNAYQRGTDFDIIHRDDAFGYAAGSAYGLWWKLTTRGTNPNNPAANTGFSLTYTYNQVPYQVSTDIANWRLLGTDLKVHAGKPAYLRFNVAVVYLPNYQWNTVNSNIEAAVGSYLQGLGFQSAVQVSDILDVIHNVPGVDNVRFLSSADDSFNYAIQKVTYGVPGNPGAIITTYHDSSGQAKDVYFDERTYPILDPAVGVAITPKARNTFRS